MSDVSNENVVITDDVEIFSDIPVNVGERHVTWVETEPTLFSKNSNNMIQFNLSGAGSTFIDLHRTYMYTRLKIVDKNNEIVDKNVMSAVPINNILHSLWSSIDVKCNGTLVGSANTNYMYKAYIDALLGNSENTKLRQMEMQGFTPTHAGFAGVSSNSKDLPFYSSAVKKRDEWWSTSYRDTVYQIQKPSTSGTEEGSATSNVKESYVKIAERQKHLAAAEFMGRLNVDIAGPEKLIMDGVDVNITLHPTYNEFRLLTYPEGSVAKIVVEDILLYVCRVTINPQLRILYEQFLDEDKRSTVAFTRADVQTFNIPKGSFGENLTNLFQGEIPRVAIIGFVLSQAYAGDFSLNPYHFQSFNVRSIGIYVDNEPVPTTCLKFDKTDTQYLRGLFSLYQASGKVGSDCDIGISRASYRLGDHLFGFLLDPTASTNAKYLGTPKYGQAKIEIKFHEALADPVTVVVYSQFPEVLEIDKARVCRLRYKSERENPKKK